jgi:hypothetical protein
MCPHTATLLCIHIYAHTSTSAGEAHSVAASRSLYMCPHTSVYICPHTTILLYYTTLLLYMCPHTSTSAGEAHSVAASKSSVVFAWGKGSSGQVPLPLNTVPNLLLMQYLVYASKSSVVCAWGKGSRGQVGLALTASLTTDTVPNLLQSS